MQLPSDEIYDISHKEKIPVFVFREKSCRKKSSSKAYCFIPYLQVKSRQKI
jgi:hypothetical protein